MKIIYPSQENIEQSLQGIGSCSLDFIVLITGAFHPLENMEGLKACLVECVRVLKPEGLLFIQGRPDYLPELGVYLDKKLTFKYWIAIESSQHHFTNGLPSVHAGLLLFTKGNNRFNVNKTRVPHQYCRACGKTLKDWGGKSHLMNPDGYVISDVWKDLPVEDNFSQLSQAVQNLILKMIGGENGVELRGIVGPKEGLAAHSKFIAEPAGQYTMAGFFEPEIKSNLVIPTIKPESMFDVVHHGDAIEILKQYPDNSIDLVFADPPYNLDKPYLRYNDEREDQQYLSWCNDWLSEYVRILKPTGSLYILNLPHWTMYHAAYLNHRLYFQNWIVWDALSEPRGKLMPAHYGLLFYTKSSKGFTFNYEDVGELDARYYCLRASCIRERKPKGINDKMPLTDIWRDIHRIKHKRDRDYHPCQLPDTLMERIIRLSSNKGDVVLDALSGAGTTAAIATQLGRRFVAIDIDDYYVKITKDKVAAIQNHGYVERESVTKLKREYTKKELQLELQNLAVKLGRLPTPEDVQTMSRYNIRVFLDTFPSWGKALKAAKLEIHENGSA